jgi:hypothetical protein
MRRPILVERREPRGGRGLVLFGRGLFRADRFDLA